MDEFVPRSGLRGGHRMTLFGWANPRNFPTLPDPVERIFEINPQTRIVAHCHWQPEPASRPTILALHGLNGSSHSHYMRGIAAKAWARGMNVVRLNQRNCGNTEHLSAGLFHSGLTEDARHVIHELSTRDGLLSIAIAGYSLGGNLALKLAGEFGDAPPPALTAVASVSPIIEIGQCTRALERPQNFVYEWNFVRELRKRMERKEQHWPGLFDLSRLKTIRSVREFDNVFTAPHFGFADADDYYYKSSAMRIVHRIGVPALIITAEDDPFVPTEPFRSPVLQANPHIELRITKHGGHCGFITRPTEECDGYWAETQIVRFVERQHSKKAELSRQNSESSSEVSVMGSRF